MSTLKEQAHRLTVQRFGHTIQLYAPLYLSNECVDTCVYCGFSLQNKIERQTLSLEEAIQEAQVLIDQGFQHLLLVSGEHPKKVSVAYLCEIAKALRSKMAPPPALSAEQTSSPPSSFKGDGVRLRAGGGVASLSIEVAPFDEESYRQLGSAGIDGVVIYQETYDPEIYKQVHLGGPKKDFERRLKCVEAACKSGMRRIGLGVLLGLSPWQKEIPKLIAHTRHLMKHYWQTQFTVSLPRLKPCASGFQAKYPVTDEEMAEIICTLRLQLPEVGLLLSTRERPELRNRLLKLGITHMSAGSRTEPGGYLHPNANGKQFELEDTRTPSEVAAAIAEAGYEPVWKDWESVLFG